MKSYIFLFFMSIFCNNLQAQTDTFPKSWLGKWSGKLEIHNAKGLAQTIPMQLHLLPTDSTHRFTWTIFYGEDTVAGKRDYELVTLDTAKGLYAIDEKIQL